MDKKPIKNRDMQFFTENLKMKNKNDKNILTSGARI